MAAIMAIIRIMISGARIHTLGSITVAKRNPDSKTED